MGQDEGTVSIDRPDVGEWTTIISCPVYIDGTEASPTGSFGEYKVEFGLGPSKYQIDQDKIGFELDGDSFIQFRDPMSDDPKQVAEVKPEAYGPNGEHGIARVVCNKHGRMSEIILDNVLANNRVHAENIAYLLVTPVISWVSFSYDVPVEIVQMISTELSTGMTATSMWMSPKIKGLDSRFQLPNIPHNPRILESIGQYREGMSSTNDLYTFLCFWKAFEGIQYIRQNLDKYIAKNKLMHLPIRESTIPELPEIRETYPEMIGKKLGYAHEHFKKTKRDAIAHLDTSTGTYVSAHNLEQLLNIRQAIPLIRITAKMAIKNELGIYEALIKLGHHQCL